MKIYRLRNIWNDHVEIKEDNNINLNLLLTMATNIKKNSDFGQNFWLFLKMSEFWGFGQNLFWIVPEFKKNYGNILSNGWSVLSQMARINRSEQNNRNNRNKHRISNFFAWSKIAIFHWNCLSFSNKNAHFPFFGYFFLTLTLKKNINYRNNARVTLSCQENAKLCNFHVKT